MLYSPDEDARLSTLYSSSQLYPPPAGTAHWMKQEELAALNASAMSAGTSIGTYLQQQVLLSPTQINRHVFITGSVERDKTSHALACFVRDFHEVRQSIVILDPYGKLKEHFSEKLSQTHAVFEMNLHPQNLFQGLQYNPLAHIPLIDTTTPETAHRTTARQEQAVATLADIWVRHTIEPVEDYPFLLRDAQWTMQACLLHLRTVVPRGPFINLAELVYKRDTLFSILQESPSQGAREILARHLAYIDKPYREKLFSTLAMHVSRLISNTLMQIKTSNNEIDFTRLLRKPTALFYSTPFTYAEGKEQVLTATFFTQLLSTLLYAHEDWEIANRSLPVEKRAADLFGVRCVLDELTTCGELPLLEQNMNQLSKYGIALVASGQGGYRRHRHSSNTAQVLFANSATHLLIGGAEPEERKTYSTLCGTTLKKDGEKLLVTPEELRTMSRPAGEPQALLYQVGEAPAIIALHNAIDDNDPELVPKYSQMSEVNTSFCSDELTSPELVYEADYTQTRAPKLY